MTALDTPMDALFDGSLGKPKLLVVDDQPINIQVMHQVFANDYQVFMATSGAQALVMCQTNPPDLVLLDMVMPGMDGFEACRQLKANEASCNIPVIFVTAHTDAAQETQGLNMGAVDFIAKPINPPMVQARIRTQLTLKFQSDLLRKLVFLADLVARYGSEKFACILPETPFDVALGLAQEWEQKPRALKIPNAHRPIYRKCFCLGGNGRPADLQREAKRVWPSVWGTFRLMVAEMNQKCFSFGVV